jgi:alpha-beta hydrolase superfamily lysophospholipase
VPDSELLPHLTFGRAPRTPRGVVLMLHGGAEADHAPVGPRSRPWQRSRLMMAQLESPFRRAGLQTVLLRYRVTGWNHGHAHRQAEHPSPVPDARWALTELEQRYDGLPFVLVGHSMGARTAAAVADALAVVGVVGLAPWFPPDDPVEQLAGRHLVAAHARTDRITSFAATHQFVQRARRVAASTELVDMGELGHYMLKGIGRWNSVARDRTIALFDR